MGHCRVSGDLAPRWLQMEVELQRGRVEEPSANSLSLCLERETEAKEGGVWRWRSWRKHQASSVRMPLHSVQGIGLKFARCNPESLSVDERDAFSSVVSLATGESTGSPQGLFLPSSPSSVWS